MLKITELTNLALKTFRSNDNKIIGDGGNKTKEMVKNLSKNLTSMSNIGTIGESIFLTPNTKKILNYLK